MPEVTKTLKVKLNPGTQEKRALDDTMHLVSEVANYIANVAHENRCWNKVALHHLTYYDVREKFALPANLACTTRDKVAEACKSAKTKRKRKFSRYTPIRLDARTFGILKDGRASISTVQERIRVHMEMGDWQRSVLNTWKVNGAAEITYRKQTDTHYLHIVVKRNVDPPEPTERNRTVGVDMGMYNLATTSHGQQHSGHQAHQIRRHHRNLRRQLLSKGTRGSRRLVKRLRGKERRQVQAINHVISRRIVDSLEPGDTLVLEDLTYIRERVKPRKEQRADFHAWPFRQLQQFIEYKALERGIAVIHVDPRDTSKTCSRCGRYGSRNGHKFSCSACDHRNHADFNAAYNLVRVASVAHPAGPRSTGPEATSVDAEAPPSGN
ncbi:MAG: RNA-guided endonuclease InsQ/TnpB family protein [Candidatus Bipolaricaulia bacterium]